MKPSPYHVHQRLLRLKKNQLGGLMRSFTTLFVSSVMLTLALLVYAQSETPKPTTAPTTAAVAGDAPVISPAATALLNSMRDAYGKLKSLELTGVASVNLDAAGEKSNEKSEFTASFQAPNQFRHEMKDDLLVVSDSKKGFVYKPDVQKYITIEPPQDRQELADFPAPVGPLLEQQNPSLLLAMVKDAGATLAEGNAKVDAVADEQIDGKNYNVLSFKGAHQEMRVYVDPATKLIRRVTTDLKERLTQSGVPQVNAAMLSVDYTKSSTDAALNAAQFAWVPPANAMLTKLQTEAAGSGEGGEEAAMAMVGKPASDFTLKDLDGKDVSLGSLKGSVVVLDFWATWCGPCRASMPHLDAMNKELAPKGLKVFAVNEAETKGAVQEFLKAEKLSLPVLFDETSKVGELYKVTGIPQTVVIGKDGIVKKVFIGFGPGGEVALRKEVDAAIQ